MVAAALHTTAQPRPPPTGEPRGWPWRCGGRVGDRAPPAHNRRLHPAAAGAPDALGYARSVRVTLCPDPAALGRRGLLHGAAAAGAALLASGALPTTPPAAASSWAAAEGAQRVAAGCAACVVAVAGIASGKAAPLGEQQLGSGVLWGPDGYVVVPYAPLTRLNRQGTAGEAQVFVSLTAADGSRHSLPAAIVARDPSHELIVLRVEPPAAGLQPAPLGTSADLRPGQDAFLLAALPGALEPTVATGVISAVGRVIPASNNQAIAGVLQTDAEVSAASLGGALLDSSGRLVGMPVVSYVKPGAGRSSGVNFALPADLLREVVPRLIVYGSAAPRR